MKMSFYKLLLLAFFLIYGDLAYSQRWISLDNTGRGTVDYTANLIESNTDCYKINVRIHGFYDAPITKNGKEYHQLFFSDRTCLSNVGEPQLPTIVRHIALPAGTNYRTSIEEITWKDVEVGLVYPAQEQCLKYEPLPDFQINDSIYDQPLYSQPMFYTSPVQSWRSIRNVNIDICPFKYYPSQRKLSVLTEFVLQVDFSNTSKAQPLNFEDVEKALQWHTFDNFSDLNIAEMFADWNVTQNRDANDYDYLIIVGNTNEILSEAQTLLDFQRWKAFKGYKTKLVTTQITGTSQSDIKGYISQEYTNHNIRYVLFIGDHDKIPLASVSAPLRTVNSDYWYGCLVGNDYEAEVPVGRFSTNSLTSLQNMVNKTISYESRFHGNYKKTLLVSDKEEAPGKYHACSDSILTANYSTPLLFTTAYGDSAATNAQVINYINSGMHIVNYRGSGQYNLWEEWNIANESFTYDEVNDIDSCAIFFNICGSNGKINNTTCMMEKMTESENAAIACLAATTYTWANPDHEYDRKLFTKLLNNNVWHLGDLNVQAHIANFTNVQFDRAKDNAYIFLCGGDPTLEIWTGTPQTFNDVSIEKNNTSITVSTTACSGFTVSVVSDSGVLIENVSTTGSSCTFTAPSGNFYVALNRHNYYPYVIYCSESEYVQNETIAYNTIYFHTPLNIGYNVTNNVPYGNVVINPGVKVSIKNGTGGVTLKNGFECKNGAEVVIQ